MAARYFTPEEANEALPRVRPLVERMVAARAALEEARGRQAELTARIAGNGGLPPSELADAREELQARGSAVADAIAELHALGVLVKDPERGLVDFPARRRGEEVLLCWLLGEDDVGYWHGLEEGFAGRKPLPL